MEDREDAIAKRMFCDWLENTSPAILHCGDEFIWRGRARNYKGEYHPWYWIRITRKMGKWKPEWEIETDCDNESMKAWMKNSEMFLKGKLVWYCRAVWDLIGARLIDRKSFDKDEADIDWDEDPRRWEMADEERLEAYAEARRYQEYCESKYGWDCS